MHRAPNDDGKSWFDVPVAVACESIIAGTLYQHLRFQLLPILADERTSDGTHYYRVNKSALSRYFPWSLSTIKRYFKEMCAKGVIAEDPARSGEYTICKIEDLIVPETMKSGSSAEMRGRSSTKKTRSSAEMTGSSTERGGSSADNITHYKPFEKHIYNTHSLTAPPSVLSECADAAAAAKEFGHKERSQVQKYSRIEYARSLRNAVELRLVSYAYQHCVTPTNLRASMDQEIYSGCAD